MSYRLGILKNRRINLSLRPMISAAEGTRNFTSGCTLVSDCLKTKGLKVRLSHYMPSRSRREVRVNLHTSSIPELYGRVESASFWSLYPHERDPLPIVKKAGWALGESGWVRKSSLYQISNSGTWRQWPVSLLTALSRSPKSLILVRNIRRGKHKTHV
jgi:hypothetical protein